MIAKEEVVLQNKDVKIEIFLHKNDTLFIRQGVIEQKPKTLTKVEKSRETLLTTALL